MELPEGPMTDILVRLPVKSLLRFKSVCRSWRSLIESPRFIAYHLKLSSSKGSSNQCHLAKYYSDLLCKNILSLLSFGSLEVISRIEVPSDQPVRYPFVTIVGSGNGIVCVKSGFKFLLLNPATRETRRLPDPIIGALYERVSCGFGCGGSIDEHKLVRIIESMRRAEVFALRYGSWREVPALDCEVVENYPGTVSDGAINWIARGRQTGREVILSFNLGDDSFEQRCLPDIREEDGECKKLFAFEESLRLIVYSEMTRDRCIIVWARDYRATRDVWTRLVSIEPPFGANRPVGWEARGEILLDNNFGQLVAYDTTTGAVRELHPDVAMSPVYFQFHSYVQSLVQLSCGSKDEARGWQKLKKKQRLR